MVFSDITTQGGLVQTVEFWTRLPYGSSGNTLKEITNRINNAFDTLMPLLLSYSDYIRWDDKNHSDRPIGTVDIVSGQNDYTIAQDGNSLDILNITRVRILNSASASDYTDLRKMEIDDPQALDAMSPNSETGTPSHYLEQGNTIYLYPKPNYAVTKGIKLFFEREQSYFVSTDTTKEAGFPRQFHELLALHASQDWIMVNRPDDSITINRLQVRIDKKEQQLFDSISLRNPTRSRMSVAQSSELSLRRNQSGRLN